MKFHSFIQFSIQFQSVLEIGTRINCVLYAAQASAKQTTVEHEQFAWTHKREGNWEKERKKGRTISTAKIKTLYEI